MDEKVSSISKTLKIPEHVVALVLYCYLGDVLQSLLLDGITSTMFGKLKMDKDGNIEFLNKKFEFDNDLFEKDDIKSILQILENGPKHELFPV